LNAPSWFDGRFSSRSPAPESITPHARYNFVGGHNDPAIIPTEALIRASADVIAREGGRLALYNLGAGPLGYPPLRSFIADKLARHRGMDCRPDDILITSGSLQGLDLVNRVLIEPGDTVLMEEFTYSGTITRARNAGVTVVGVEVDREGMRIDALAAKLDALRAAGVRPRYIYTIPTIQNPTGGILGLERRRQMVALSREHGVPIFEDECYADLAWSADAPPALHALAPDQVVHIGSFSKTLAPALRLGYIVAPPPVLARLLGAKTDGGTGALDQMVAAEYFSRFFDEHVGTLKTALKRKLGVMLDAIAEEFGTDAEIWTPEGGIFVWMKLPDSVDVRGFEAAALAAGVSFNAGPAWSCSIETGKSCLRLCFALPSEADIREGVATLARVCFETTGIPARGANRDRAR
jgi:2-aminoadipate transaminase